jgi:hypothetical protein
MSFMAKKIEISPESILEKFSAPKEEADFLHSNIPYIPNFRCSKNHHL